MKRFHCGHCAALVFFESVSCVQCQHALGFLPDIMDMAALEPVEDQHWKSLGEAAAGRQYRACANGKDALMERRWGGSRRNGHPESTSVVLASGWFRRRPKPAA